MNTKIPNPVIDKTWKFFFIQAIYGFIEQDYETGTHFLTELQEHYDRHTGKFSQVIEEISMELTSIIKMAQVKFVESQLSQVTTNSKTTKDIIGQKPALSSQKDFSRSKEEKIKDKGDTPPVFKPKIHKHSNKIKVSKSKFKDGSDQLEDILHRRQQRKKDAKYQ